MNFLKKNKLNLSASNQQIDQQNCGKGDNKKKLVIKLEVNKLLKPVPINSLSNKNFKNELFYSHDSSKQQFDQNQPLQNVFQLKAQKRITKTFEQLYYQKLKQLKLQENRLITIQNDQKHFENLKVRPNSCKNINSIKNKKKSFIQQRPQSTKNSTYEPNKENIFVQKNKQVTLNHEANKFFKKKDLEFLGSQTISFDLTKSLEKVVKKQLNQQESKFQQQKIKKILKLKKPTKNGKVQTKIGDEKDISDFGQILQTFSMNTGKECDTFQKGLKGEEEEIISLMNSSLNPSLELKTFKLSIPSSSGQKQSNFTQTEIKFDEISSSKLNHFDHEHIWNETQCFLSFVQFELILQQIGFKENIKTKEIQFYVNKLWENMGGNIYGGVVRKNMKEFLNLVLEEDSTSCQEFTEIMISKEQLSLESSFVDKCSLRLIRFNEKMKNQIRKFYHPFRVSKVQLQFNQTHFKSSSSPKLESQNRAHQSTIKQKGAHLQNIAYLETISVENRDLEMSPYMMPKSYNDINDLNMVTDFSPKLSAQQYEPFKSTILSKELEFNEQKSIERQNYQTPINQPTRKPLLSVDVNLGEGILQKLMVYEDQNPYEVSLQLKERYNIDEELREKFEKMLRTHLNTLLFKIQEVSQELFEDSFSIPGQQLQKGFILMDKQEEIQAIN